MTRRVIASVLLVLALVVTPLSPTSAAPAPQACDQTQKLNSVDAAFNAKINRLKNFQSSYLLAHPGKYYQALWSHDAIPDGNLAPINQNATRPHYQQETLQSIIDGANIPAQIPNRFKVDWYEGPSGIGYVITIDVMACGKHMERSVNVGAETYRDAAWHEVVVSTP